MTPDPSPAATSRRRVLWLSFIESFATISLERAIYFFSHERLGYSESQNLMLALAFGVTYTAGAALSHRLAWWLGDRRALCATLVCLLGLHVLAGLWPRGGLLIVSFAAVGWFEGAKWPIIESYVGAGLGPTNQLGAIGRFNVSWALAVPLAIAVSGPVIASGWPELLFLLAAAANVLALVLSAGLPRGAPHLAEAHAGRADAEALARYARLLKSSRWTMLSGHALMFLVAPLLPEVFQRLGRPVAEATLWASCMDAVRVVTFAALATFPGWHGRAWPLAAAALGLPVGFAMIVLGPSLPLVVFGEVVFGALAGVTYYAALYHAMVVKNAAVDAGGGHESLIGMGLALGPGVGLLGDLLAREGNNPLVGISLAAAPLVLTCWFGALRALPRSRSARANVGLS